MIENGRRRGSIREYERGEIKRKRSRESRIYEYEIGGEWLIRRDKSNN